MNQLTQRVETKIKNCLPEKFALVFAGKTEGDTHFVALFTSGSFETTVGYITYLIGLSLFENEDSQDADQHKAYFEFVTDLYGRSFKNIVATLGDN